MDKPQYDVRMVFVTPEEARAMMQRNYEKNRRISNRTVSKYRSDFESGKWNPYAAGPIIIASDGTMIDGQHRMQALANSGIEGCWFEFREDVPASAFDLVDSGKGRTVSDVLDVRNKNQVASLATSVKRVLDGVKYRSIIKGNCVVSKAEVLEVIEADKDGLSKAVEALNTIRHQTKKAHTLPVGLPLYVYSKTHGWAIEYITDDIKRAMPEDSRVASYKMQFIQAVAQDKATTEKQMALTVRLIESIVYEEGELKRVVAIDKANERFMAQAKSVIDGIFKDKEGR